MTCVDFIFHSFLLSIQSCVRPADLMAEVNASLPGQQQEVGAVLGRVLYHALRGHCFIGHSLPEESFFLDYIVGHVGSENFTIDGKPPVNTSVSSLFFLLSTWNQTPALGLYRIKGFDEKFKHRPH